MPVRRRLRSSALLGASVGIVALVALSVGAIFAAHNGIPARVVRVIDGDTIAARAGFLFETRIRLAGIDTPELNGACDLERDIAYQARAYLRDIIGEEITLHGVSRGKYRWVAWVSNRNGQDLSLEMLRQGYARVYDGQSKRKEWC